MKAQIFDQIDRYIGARSRTGPRGTRLTNSSKCLTFRRLKTLLPHHAHRKSLTPRARSAKSARNRSPRLNVRRRRRLTRASMMPRIGCHRKTSPLNRVNRRSFILWMKSRRHQWRSMTLKLWHSPRSQTWIVAVATRRSNRNNRRYLRRMRKNCALKVPNPMPQALYRGVGGRRSRKRRSQLLTATPCSPHQSLTLKSIRLTTISSSRRRTSTRR